MSMNSGQGGVVGADFTEFALDDGDAPGSVRMRLRGVVLAGAG
jgi:hypothetical protein